MLRGEILILCLTNWFFGSRRCQFFKTTTKSFLRFLFSIVIKSFDTDCYFLALLQRKVLAWKINSAITWLLYTLRIPKVVSEFIQSANEVKSIVSFSELNPDIGFLTSLLIDQ